MRTQRTRQSKPGIPIGSVYVGRPSQWGNPFVIGEWYDGVRVWHNFHAVAMFYEHCKEFALKDPEAFLMWLKPLSGRDLCCWCNVKNTCHADILIYLTDFYKSFPQNPISRTDFFLSIESWRDLSEITAV